MPTLCDGLLLALRDRLRAGDIWVESSRQWRAVEDQLIPPALFAAMREAGPLPVAVPATAAEYLAGRRALLERRLGEVNAKAAAPAGPRLALEVLADNAPALALYGRFSFGLEGVRRDAVFRAGAYADVLAMARLRR